MQNPYSWMLTALLFIKPRCLSADKYIKMAYLYNGSYLLIKCI